MGALEHLIGHIVPNDPDEDPETAQERHDACLEHVASIIEGYLVISSDQLVWSLFRALC